MLLVSTVSRIFPLRYSGNQGIADLQQYHSVRHREHLLVASFPHSAQPAGSMNSSAKVFTHLESRHTVTALSLCHAMSVNVHPTRLHVYIHVVCPTLWPVSALSLHQAPTLVPRGWQQWPATCPSWSAVDAHVSQVPVSPGRSEMVYSLMTGHVHSTVEPPIMQNLTCSRMRSLLAGGGSMMARCCRYLCRSTSAGICSNTGSIR